ncbi:MAG: HlyD family secretion protein, partial [Xanthobacteraceae bacterium]|nr:HlyD family secretion protein [Xanthobacteraceae bacterium]
MGDQTDSTSAERLDRPRGPSSRERNLRITGPGEQRREDEQKNDPPRDQRGLVRRHPLLAALAVLVVVVVIVGGVMWWREARNYQSTDDAFIDARNVSVSAQVVGAITEVPVSDNERVATGGLLVQVDPRDYEAAVAEAEAQVAQANAAIANLDAQIEEQQARIDQAEKQVVQSRAALTFAEQENTRAQDLVKRGAGTQQAAQQTSSTLIQGQAGLASAQANLVAAQKQVPMLEAQRASAQAQLKQMEAALQHAKDNLGRTRLVAPEPGRATKISAAVGALAQPGQVLMIFVPESKWVTANFKETQLTHMRPGQPVDIAIDAYPSRVFKGHVDSIQAGSGAAFSLLPPENATGNFVKVVQRVPVKIVFETP